MTDIEKQIKEVREMLLQAKLDNPDKCTMVMTMTQLRLMIKHAVEEDKETWAKIAVERMKRIRKLEDKLDCAVEALKEICTYEKETNAYNTIAYEALEKVADKTTGQEIIDGLKWAIKEEKKCKFCKKEKDTLCEHGYCPACQCPEYCWLD